MDPSIISEIKFKFPKLFITEKMDNNAKFVPEKNDGFIEYKRTLINCDDSKIQRYATQMRWRIGENARQYAIYFIGIDDDGKIVGLSNSEIIDNIDKFIKIAKSIGASITRIQFTYIDNRVVLRIRVKNKRIKNNYIVDFE